MTDCNMEQARWFSGEVAEWKTRLPGVRREIERLRREEERLRSKLVQCGENPEEW